MCSKSSTLSSGLEDYLEAIYVSHINNDPLKGADLARKLNISRASVSEALSKLVAKDLIKYNSYEAISITKLGISEARKVYTKHYILKNFFEEILEIESEEASHNACEMEHIISQNVLNKIVKFTEFCEKNKEFIDKFKQEMRK